MPNVENLERELERVRVSASEIRKMRLDATAFEFKALELWSEIQLSDRLVNSSDTSSLGR
jgi:hypothetical protein